MKRAVLAVLLVVARPAAAAMNTAEDMETNCRLLDTMDKNNPVESLNGAMCAGFIVGIHETMALWKGLSPPAPFCLPENGISIDQGRRLFLKFLQENPKDLNRRPALAYIEAIHNAFPCPPKK